jgi:hypothetical protein
MHKKIMVLVLAICFFVGATTVALGGIEPSPWKPLREDLRLFQQELAPAKAKLGEAKPGTDLTKLGLLKSHEDMMRLLQSLQTKVQGLEGTKGQTKGVLDICAKMKPKLDNLGFSLKNFKLAIQQGDKPTAHGLLNQIGETIKGLEALLPQLQK